MENRLELEGKDISEKVLLLTDQQKAWLIQLVCEYVIEQNAINNELVFEALAKLKHGNTPDQQMKDSLQSMTNELDVIGWDIQDLVDEGKAAMSEYHTAFGRARAVNALVYAFEEDLSVAITESLYEAMHAVDDMDEVRNLIGGYLASLNECNENISPLDVKGIDTNITRDEIVESIRESREDRY